MKRLSGVVVSMMLVAGVHAAEKTKVVDISNDGIFNAVSHSHNLQKTVNTLIAHGANQHSVISIAAAAGIPQNKIMQLQVCVNTVSDDVTQLSATCMRPKTVMTAYQNGLNDPLNYLSATAAGNKPKK